MPADIYIPMSPSPSLNIDLPAPNARDAADSALLCAQIHQACKDTGGTIGFDQYMELALYTPRLGYYSAARTRFGKDGDFVTAAEISPRFAMCVARQIAQVFDMLGDTGAVLEVGAGSGVLAEGVLDTLRTFGYDKVQYFILERSAGGRGFQGERLARFGEQVRWIDDFPPSDFTGVILANELLDAIAPRCFEIHDGEAVELGVESRSGQLAWRLMPNRDEVTDAQWRELVADTFAHEHLAELAQGYRGEIAPARQAWVRSAAQSLRAGALLLLDYGYPRHELYHSQRLAGTLACHFRHRVHSDPFLWPGLQDIGSHVDFTAIAQAGVDSGLELAGYTTQAHFLLDCGLLDGLEDVQLDERARIELTAQIQRLTLPAELGEAIKVIALCRKLAQPLCGFQSRNLSQRL
jgi:SAM-dependent MidA family methyltransferase